MGGGAARPLLVAMLAVTAALGLALYVAPDAVARSLGFAGDDVFLFRLGGSVIGGVLTPL